MCKKTKHCGLSIALYTYMYIVNTNTPLNLHVAKQNGSMVILLFFFADTKETYQCKHCHKFPGGTRGNEATGYPCSLHLASDVGHHSILLLAVHL